MHSPEVVAFEVRRPWPRRDRTYDSIRPGRDKPGPRWRFKLHLDCWTCDEQELREHAGRRFFPWWKPSSWSPFWTVAGRGWYWPPIVVVWHIEPGGHDSGTICMRWKTNNTGEQRRYSNTWKWHVWHWRLQFPPLQQLRRRLLTRCEWCGGPSRRNDPINIGHGHTKRKPWWRGERGLYHLDCSSIEHAHRACLCDDPLTARGDYGECLLCGKFVRYGRGPVHPATRLLAAVPTGHRDHHAYTEACRLWKLDREPETA
jgi:hypothetical protein